MTDQTESPVQASESLAYEKLEKSAGLSAHRAKAISLPDCPIKASAAVLRFVTSGSTSMDVSAAVEAMTARVASLQSTTGDALEKELLGHACTLDGLFQRWVYASVAAADADLRVKWAKLAVQTHESYMRTLVCFQGLKAERQRQRPRLPDQADD